MSRRTGSRTSLPLEYPLLLSARLAPPSSLPLSPGPGGRCVPATIDLEFELPFSNDAFAVAHHATPVHENAAPSLTDTPIPRSREG